jgi:hypothetical protein
MKSEYITFHYNNRRMVLRWILDKYVEDGRGMEHIQDHA